MADSISFNSVSPNNRASNLFIELAGVSQSLSSYFIPPTIGLVGQYDSAKTGIVDYEPVRVVSRDDVGSKYGYGSHIHRQALRLPESVFLSGGGVWAFPVPEVVAGVAASADITFVGTATSAGTFYFLIGGELVRIAVSSGDTATGIATNFVNAITAIQNIGVSATSALGVVTISCKWKGASGNQIYIKQSPAGKAQEDLAPIGITVSGIDAYLTGGATDPDLHDVFFETDNTDRLGDRWYTVFSIPYTDSTNIGYYSTSGDLRADPATHRFFGAYAAYVENKTYAQALAVPGTINKEWIGTIWENRSWAPAFELSAELIGIIAREQNLAPNRPYKTLELSIPADSSITNRSPLAVDALFRAGMGFCKINSSGVLTLGDIALTYRTNSGGGATEEWFDAVSLHLRQAKVYSIEQLFASEPYTRGVVVDNASTTTVNFAISPKDVIADLTKLVKDLWEPFAWTKNADEVISSISAEISSITGSRINATVTDDEAKALRVIAMKYAFLF